MNHSFSQLKATRKGAGPRVGWGGGVVLPTILGGGVPHGSQNPDPISDQNI